MKTPSLHIARLEAELAERCLELAEARQRINELEYRLGSRVLIDYKPMKKDLTT